MKTMKTIQLLLVVVLFSGFLACSSDDDNGTSLLQTTSETISNLYAPQVGGQGQGEISGEFTKFNLETGLTTSSNTDWDIAFRGTSIILNGGISLGTNDEPERTGDAAGYIVDNTFANVSSVNTELLEQDSDEGYVLTDWYTYSGPPNHLITPTPGKILVLRTHDGKYAKIEILSYYKNAPEDPDAFTDEARYYTFNYVYQPNTGETSF